MGWTGILLLASFTFLVGLAAGKKKAGIDYCRVSLRSWRQGYADGRRYEQTRSALARCPDEEEEEENPPPQPTHRYRCRVYRLMPSGERILVGDEVLEEVHQEAAQCFAIYKRWAARFGKDGAIPALEMEQLPDEGPDLSGEEVHGA